jgi:type IV secretory pathway VirB9-like protein
MIEHASTADFHILIKPFLQAMGTCGYVITHMENYRLLLMRTNTFWMRIHTRRV